METTMPGVNTPSTTNVVDLTNYRGSFAVPKPVPTNYNSFIQSLQTELPNLQNEVNTYQTALDNHPITFLNCNHSFNLKYLDYIKTQVGKRSTKLSGNSMLQILSYKD